MQFALYLFVHYNVHCCHVIDDGTCLAVLLSILFWFLITASDCLCVQMGYLSAMLLILFVADDFSRVKLIGVSGKGKDTDYINASYIDVCYIRVFCVLTVSQWLCMWVSVSVFVSASVCVCVRAHACGYTCGKLVCMY